MSTLKVDDIQSRQSTDDAISLGADSSVTLKHSASAKLATTSSGVDVTGTCTATTFSGSGASLTSLPAANITGTLPAIDGSALTGLSAGAYEFVSKTTVSSGTVSYFDFTLDQDNIYKIICSRMSAGAGTTYPMIKLFTNGSSSLDTSNQYTTEYHYGRSSGSYRNGVNDMEIDAGQYGNNLYYEMDVSTYLYGWIKVHGSLLRTSTNSSGSTADCRFDSYCQHDDFANKYISGVRLYGRFASLNPGTQFLVYKYKQS